MDTNRRMMIASLPSGSLSADDFVLDEVAVTEPGDGEVVVETLALTIGAGQRAGLQGSASYAGAPQAGRVMDGTGVGRVVASRADGVAEGELVRGQLGWQSHPTMAADQLEAVPADTDPAHALGPLGTNGLAAYFGLHELGRPEEGQTLVVSAAAGSVGHLVGQMAKIHGARVVGVAGSDDKCRMVVDDLGFDEAVNYRADDFRDRFKAATPDRIDVYFDNTGGDILGSALFRMALHGRIVCCGAVSQYDTSTPDPSPRGIPGLLVNNRVRMEGYVVFDYADRYAEGRAQMSAWIGSGEVRPLATEFDGLTSAGQAFVELLNGSTVGTTIVRVAS
ncbi:MAG: NADP-dependent oxidoreductase [Acidimicrobiales bacterium]